MTLTSFAVAADQRWFEDYGVGMVYQFGGVNVSAQEIIEFARRYDPQAMHIDAAAAAQGEFGGLIASGWMTMGLTMRLLVDHYISTCAALPSPGFDTIRWLEPVRPGDDLSLRVTILSARISQSRPDRGIVQSRFETLNQHARIVLTSVGTGMMLRRPR